MKILKYITALLLFTLGVHAQVAVKVDGNGVLLSPANFFAANGIAAGNTALLKANNLSDIPSPSTARANLSLTIGVHVQAYSANLDTFASNGPAYYLNWTHFTNTPTTISGYGITDPLVYTSGTYSNPSWITALAWGKITGTPTTISGYGITDPLVYTSGTYSNPSWITALAWGKITGTPTSVAGYGVTNGSTLDTIAAAGPLNTGAYAVAYVLPTATSSTLGGVKPDGTSILNTAGVLSVTPTSIGIGSVTNDAQTKASIVPNTVPSAGRIMVGNAGGTAYAPVAMSSDAIIDSTGAVTLTNGSSTRSHLGLTIGTNVEAPLTFSTGLTRTSNTITVNTSQIISNLIPGTDFTLTQNGINVITSVYSGAKVDSLYITAGNIGIGTSSPNVAGFGVGTILTVQGNGKGVIECATNAADSSGNTAGYFCGSAVNNTGSHGKQIGAIDVETIGTTANDRGGIVSVYTKKDGGAFTQAMLIDQFQNIQIPNGALYLNGAWSANISGLSPSLARTDSVACAEFRNSGSHAGIVLFDTGAATTVADGEQVLYFYALDSGANTKQTGSVSANWINTDPTVGYTVSRLIATYSGGTLADVGIKLYGNDGLSLLDSSTSSYTPPGAGVVWVNGNLLAKQSAAGTIYTGVSVQNSAAIQAGNTVSLSLAAAPTATAWNLQVVQDSTTITDNRFKLYPTGAGVNPFVLHENGDLAISGTFSTADPTNGSGAWKLGKVRTSTAATASTTSVIEVMIDGARYDLMTTTALF